jgi:pimeloyl-ACP methyl ester carboxylesterase
LLEEPPVDSATSLLRASNIDPRIAARLGESCITASRAIYNSFRQGPTIQQLASVRVPTLVVRGSRPNAVGDGADSLLMVLPNARLVTLLGAGHDPWFDWPKSFFAHLERFLRVSLQH